MKTNTMHFGMVACAALSLAVILSSLAVATKDQSTANEHRSYRDYLNLCEKQEQTPIGLAEFLGREKE